MELKFTDEEFDYLKTQEERFYTAVMADWARNPGSLILKSIHNIYSHAVGRTEPLRENCAHCILRLLKEVGTLYYQDKAERERRAANEKAKAESKPKVEPQIKPKEELSPKESKTASPQPKKAVKGKKTSNKKK